MSQMTNLERNTAETMDIGLDSTLPRLVTVTGVKGRLVRVQYPEEAVGGETWFPTTELGVTIGMMGVVTRMRGNAGYFTPLAMPATKKPMRGVQSLTTTRTTSTPDIDFTDTVNPLGNVPGSKVTGLLPNTVYQVTVTAMIAMNSSSAGTWRIVAKFPTGGVEALSGFTLTAAAAIGLDTWQWFGEVTSNAAGEISAHPAARWVSGSITSSRAEIILRVEPA